MLPVVVGIVTTSALARADVTGSHDGQLVVKHVATPIAAAGVLSQTGTSVTGTLAIGGDSSAAGGQYMVTGKATPKRLKVAGVAHGVALVWKAKIAGDTLAGRLRLKGVGVKTAGTLTLVRNPALADGSTCDAVFTSNQTYFTTQVQATALLACTACHVPGGQAEATRFHVTTTDALATARSVAAFVDSANPDGSRILEKPLLIVPHGGGQQMLPGSNEEQILRHWVGLIAAAGCR